MFVLCSSALIIIMYCIMEQIANYEVVSPMCIGSLPTKLSSHGKLITKFESIQLNKVIARLPIL